MTRNHVKNHHFPMVSYGYSMLTPSKKTHFRLTFGRVYSDSPAGMGSRWSSPVPPLKRKVPWPIRAMRRSTAQSMRYGDMLYIYIYILYIYVCDMIYCVYDVYIYTSSTAQGGGGSFKKRKPIGEVGCCESGMAERSH